MNKKNHVLLVVVLVFVLASIGFGTIQAQDKPFAGIKVVVANNAGGNSDYFKLAAAPWEEATGATVEMNPIPFGDIKDKVLAAMSTDTFIADIVVVPSGISGDLMSAGYVIPLSEESLAAIEADDLFTYYRELNLSWGGVQYAWPWDGDVHTLNYRADIFDDPANQEAFKAAYGYDLAVPTTWKQYADIAKWITETNPAGVPYGWAEVAGRRNGLFHAFSDRAVGYAKHPDDPAFYFDTETMDARVNNPGFVRALEDWVAALPYAPPDVTRYGFSETRDAFITGLAALVVNWTDVGVAANDPNMSVLTPGQASYAILPGSTEVWNSLTGAWETFETPNQPGYAAFGGWIMMIPKNAQQMEAAVSLADFMGSRETMSLASQTPGSGVNPARISTLNDLAGWVEKAGFPTEENARAYVDSIKNSLETTNVVFQLRIPGYNQYEDTLEQAVSEVLAGQKTAQQALDEAAAAWNAITDQLGRENQLKYYRASIGLE
ncbi:MAG: extracellular solute-binding protein [Chloroflexi bacterium]|nr:extracellular solute-binding protein [Chloroflexota bacterium]